MFQNKPRTPIPPKILYIGTRDEFVQGYFVRDAVNFQCSDFPKSEPATKDDLVALHKAVVELADWAQTTSSKMSDPFFAKHNLAPQPHTTRMGGGEAFIPISPYDIRTGILIEGGKAQIPEIWYKGGSAPQQEGPMVRWGRFEAALELAIQLLSPKKK